MTVETLGVDDSIEDARALRMLDMVSPSQVVEWAANELTSDSSSESMTALAIADPSGREGVDRILDVPISSSPDQADLQFAQSRIARRILRAIVEGRRDAIEGARDLYFLSSDAQTLSPQLLPYVGIVSEWDDSGSEATRPQFEAAILRDAARDLTLGTFDCGQIR
jgi:hypothetical protein